MVYVDDMKAAYRGMVMCHMLADTHNELLRMAHKIGVQRRWLQEAGTYREHFDICASKRKLAIAAGAVALTKDQLGKMLQVRREMWLASRIKQNNPPNQGGQEQPLTPTQSSDCCMVHPYVSGCETSGEKSKS